MATSLFKTGYFTLHSGIKSQFKIDCDALNFQSLKALTFVVRDLVGPFSEVHGVPTGGLALADELRWFANKDSDITLIVDDVLTTGRSMEEFRAGLHDTKGDRNYRGLVIFARGPVPDWVTPIFTVNPEVRGHINDSELEWNGTT